MAAQQEKLRSRSRLELVLDRLRWLDWPLYDAALDTCSFEEPKGRIFKDPSLRARVSSIHYPRLPFESPWTVVLVDFGDWPANKWIVRLIANYSVRSGVALVKRSLSKVFVIAVDGDDQVSAFHIDGAHYQKARMAKLDLGVISHGSLTPTSALKQLTWDDRARWMKRFRPSAYVVQLHPQDRSRIELDEFAACSEALGELARRGAASPKLEPSREYALIGMAQSGNVLALERLIDANLSYLIEYAARSNRKRPEMGAPLEDIVSEAIIAFHKTVMSYDLKKGGPLRQRWELLSQQVTRAIDRYRKDFPIPRHAMESWLAGRLQHGLNQQRAVAGIPLVPLSPLFYVVDSLLATYDEFGELGESDLESLAEDLPSPDAFLAWNEEFESRLAVLSEKERLVMLMRTGFDPRCADSPTLENIATILNVTRERVRQIEISAKKKLAKLPPCLSDLDARLT